MKSFLAKNEVELNRLFDAATAEASKLNGRGPTPVTPEFERLMRAAMAAKDDPAQSALWLCKAAVEFMGCHIVQVDDENEPIKDTEVAE